jgi:hypothetical protein
MEDWGKYEPKFRYMMLSRLKQNCDYSLRYFNGSENVLWAKDKASHDPEDRPEWLTWDELCDYAQRMGVEIKVEITPVHYFRKNREDDETND